MSAVMAGWLIAACQAPPPAEGEAPSQDLPDRSDALQAATTLAIALNESGGSAEWAAMEAALTGAGIPRGVLASELVHIASENVPAEPAIEALQLQALTAASIRGGDKVEVESLLDACALAFSKYVGGFPARDQHARLPAAEIEALRRQAQVLSAVVRGSVQGGSCQFATDLWSRISSGVEDPLRIQRVLFGGTPTDHCVGEWEWHYSHGKR